MGWNGRIGGYIQNFLNIYIAYIKYYNNFLLFYVGFVKDPFLSSCSSYCLVDWHVIDFHRGDCWNLATQFGVLGAQVGVLSSQVNLVPKYTWCQAYLVNKFQWLRPINWWLVSNTKVCKTPIRYPFVDRERILLLCVETILVR